MPRLYLLHLELRCRIQRSAVFLFNGRFAAILCLAFYLAGTPVQGESPTPPLVQPIHLCGALSAAAMQDVFVRWGVTYTNDLVVSSEAKKFLDRSSGFISNRTAQAQADFEEGMDGLRELYGSLEFARQYIKNKYKHPKFDLRLLDLWEAHLFYIEPLREQRMASVSLRNVSDSIGLGVFAEQPLAKGDYVGEYTGTLKLRGIQADSTYLFSSRFPRLKTEGNFTRFINHSKHGNLVYYYIYLDSQWHVVFVASKDIAKGEELRFDYGSSYWGGDSPEG